MRRSPAYLPALNARQRARRRESALRWVVSILLGALIIGAALVHGGAP